ncbi:hypothetical protein [Methylomonas rivi]|uniref:Uncharacterized protein n=1 Tax=Methylomonas rivi TaxID=2952226 RepID=A0ABT1UA67_9GAMM|nr:hypothetical protein [Methylomonas sp. WSC-6]MCQ8130264.1 hypothetical protein [Methylomonas sp. WSC-6]
MSSLIYLTRDDLDGPWLLDRTAMLQLSEILNSLSDKLTITAETLIESELSEYFGNLSQEDQQWDRDRQRKYLTERYNLKTKCKVSFSSSKYIEDKSLGRLLGQPELQEEATESIDIELRAANISVNVEFRKNSFSGAKVSVRTSPETDELARYSFVELQHWAIEHQAPRWQRFLEKQAPMHWFVYIIFVWISANGVPSESDRVYKELSPIAVEIVKDGITAAETPKALELILRKEFSLPIQDVSPQTSSWFNLLFFGGFAVSIILSIRPTLVIGIGKHAETLKLWKWWLKLIGVSIPSFICGSILWPEIIEIAKSLL